MPIIPAESAPPHDVVALASYRPWLYAAALYNLLWGSSTILFPQPFFHLIGARVPTLTPLWQCIGMFVLVYAPANYWAALLSLA